MHQSSLAASTVRNLGQKEYEKRKHAALEVENLVREHRDAGEFDRIASLILQMHSLAESPQPNVRKGVLHALAGTAIGMRQDVHLQLEHLLKPVLASFSDPDARVRYYGCEALYNIAKVARAACVRHFNEIFDGLFKLSADTDTQVQSGMQLLDRLIKDVVTEADNFEVEAFMPLLGERVYVVNPFSRQFLVGWIATLDSVPDIEMLSHLPVFLDGLFHMLADPNKEIRSQVRPALSPSRLHPFNPHSSPPPSADVLGPRGVSSRDPRRRDRRILADRPRPRPTFGFGRQVLAPHCHQLAAHAGGARA